MADRCCHRARCCDARQRQKPPGFVKMRKNTQRQRGATLVPYAIVVTSRDVKGVIPWPQKAVLGGAASAGFDVIFIQSVQFVTKPHSVRRNKAQSGKPEFDLTFAGSDRKSRLRSAERGVLAIHHNVLNDDGGR